MVQTLLLKTIIENAEKVMIEFGGEYITASHVVVAVADFCKTRYNGLEIRFLHTVLSPSPERVCACRESNFFLAG